LYSGAVMNDLGTFGGAQSTAYGINNLGQVVGGAYTSGSREHAFLYRAGVMTDLGTLGGYESRAYGINAAGQVVGFAATVGGGDHAFLYSGGIMTDLNNVIDTNSGWSLEVATAINDGGQIVGVGTYPTNQLRAFLLTPRPTLQISLTSSNSVQIQFTAVANTGYLIEYRDSLSSGSWQVLVVLDPIAVVHSVIFTDPLPPGSPRRFYRVAAS
jgi:probable HAF family extracellular repeat protein